MAAGCLAGFVACMIVYPLDMLRTCASMSGAPTGYIPLIRAVYSTSGARGFYRVSHLTLFLIGCCQAGRALVCSAGWSTAVCRFCKAMLQAGSENAHKWTWREHSPQATG